MKMWKLILVAAQCRHKGRKRQEKMEKHSDKIGEEQCILRLPHHPIAANSSFDFARRSEESKVWCKFIAMLWRCWRFHLVLEGYSGTCSEGLHVRAGKKRGKKCLPATITMTSNCRSIYIVRGAPWHSKVHYSIRLIQHVFHGQWKEYIQFGHDFNALRGQWCIVHLVI